MMMDLYLQRHRLAWNHQQTKNTSTTSTIQQIYNWFKKKSFRSAKVCSASVHHYPLKMMHKLILTDRSVQAGLPSLLLLPYNPLNKKFIKQASHNLRHPHYTRKLKLPLIIQPLLLDKDQISLQVLTVQIFQDLAQKPVLVMIIWAPTDQIKEVQLAVLSEDPV